MAIREKFEAENDDANINLIDKENDKNSDDDSFFNFNNLDFKLKRSTYKKSKFGGIPHYNKKHVSTFGTV